MDDGGRKLHPDLPLQRDGGPVSNGYLAIRRISSLQQAVDQVRLKRVGKAETPEFDAFLQNRMCADDQMCPARGNLLQNAADFSPAESPIAVTVAPAAGQATLRVCDRGPGLPG